MSEPVPIRVALRSTPVPRRRQRPFVTEDRVRNGRDLDKRIRRVSAATVNNTTVVAPRYAASRRSNTPGLFGGILRRGRREVLLFFGSLPEEAAELLSGRPDFGHRLGVVNETVLHCVVKLCDVVNVLQRIGREYQEIGALARLQRADVAIHSDLARGTDRRLAQGLHVREAPKLQPPQFPLRAQTLSRAVTAERNESTGVGNRRRALRHLDPVLLVIRHVCPSLPPSFENVFGREAPQLDVVVDLVPRRVVLLHRRATVRHANRPPVLRAAAGHQSNTTAAPRPP